MFSVTRHFAHQKAENAKLFKVYNLDCFVDFPILEAKMFTKPMKKRQSRASKKSEATIDSVAPPKPPLPLKPEVENESSVQNGTRTSLKTKFSTNQTFYFTFMTEI